MIAMEPQTENRPTIETAREQGRQRLDKVLNFIAPIMAPDVLLEMGKNAAQDKISEAQEKMTSLKNRVEKRATEIRDRFVEKATAAYDRFENRFNAAKDKTVATAKEMGRRAAIVGLTPIAAGEAVWVEIYKSPIHIREAIIDMKDKKADEYLALVKELRESTKGHREAIKSTEEKAKTMNSARRTLDRIKAAA